MGAFCKGSLGVKGIRVQDFSRGFSFGKNDTFAIQIDLQTISNMPFLLRPLLMEINGISKVLMIVFKDNNWNTL
ncbi:hypothetical protein [uncultured Polaribacter sp.]|uniref:hypothetical protein n=1 Tax=uncultured Polaribacter sp. TaxID=174711 RepID=UPI00260BC202|nr:hypothetical protein [uncultured Polaribacter sp.]